MSENSYTYIFADSWINLFYQIIKIYQFTKINLKMLKNASKCPEYISLTPEYLNETSNIYSSAELTLIRWIEVHSHQPEVRMMNLENDLRDGRALASLILSFVKSNTI